MIDKLGEKLLEILASIVRWFFETLTAPFADILTLKELVFGKSDEGELVWKTFSESDITNVAGPMFYVSAVIAGFFILAFIVLAGGRTAGRAVNYTQRNEFIESAKDLLFVGLVIFNLPTLYDFMFMLNNGIVDVFASAYDSELDGMLEREMGLTNIIGMVLVNLVILGLMVWANFYYMMRKITLIILMGLGPLMMAFWLHPKFKGITAAWIKELIGSIFVQSIHAVTFWTVALLSAESSDKIIETTIVYLVFIPVAESIRGLLGMGGNMQGGLAKSGAMLGVGALAGMMGAAKGAFQGESVMGALKGAASGVKNQMNGKGGNVEDGVNANATGAVPGSNHGTDLQAKRMLKAGEIGSKAGKAVLGMAGAVVGSPMGPGGAIIGASAGSMAGGVVGGLGGRTIGPHVNNTLGAFARPPKGKNKDGFDSNFAKEIAGQQTSDWAENNKDDVMAGLSKQYPGASPSELEKRFDTMKAQKHAGFYKSAKANLGAIKAGAGNFADGNALVSNATQGMTNKWAADNQKGFLADYDKNNPQQPGESQKDYLARRTNAWNDKVSSMKDAFQSSGQSALSKISSGSNPIVNKDAFMQQLGNQVSNIPGVGNASSVLGQAQRSVQHLMGDDVLVNKGKPNVSFIAGQMANIKTAEMKNDFIAGEISKGATPQVAAQNWASREQATHKNNVASFATAASSAQGKTFDYSNLSLPGIAADGVRRVANVAATATGVPTVWNTGASIKNAIGTTMKGAAHGITAAKIVADTSGMGAMQTAKTVVTGGVSGAIQYRADQLGGAVAAQATFQNKVGYVAGVIGGQAAYGFTKNKAASISPYAKLTQQAISSPAEVIQMAESYVDDNGQQRIAPGAIRQVITPDSSYIEVRGKTGETQIVSRQAAGHSGMHKNDVVYQDLTVEGDSLVVAKPMGGGSSTYRIDSGGARVPSSVIVSSNPNQLLGNPMKAPHSAPREQISVPSYNQTVDSGQFYVEDAKQLGMTEMEIIVEKNRSYLQAQKGTATYRISPYYAGDTRVANDTSKTIKVNVDNYSLIPEVPSDDYIPNFEISSMLPSKNVEQVQRRLNKRKEIEAARRKQGILG